MPSPADNREDVFIFNAVTFEGNLGEEFLNSEKGLDAQKTRKDPQLRPRDPKSAWGPLYPARTQGRGSLLPLHPNEARSPRQRAMLLYL